MICAAFGNAHYGIRNRRASVFAYNKPVNARALAHPDDAAEVVGVFHAVKNHYKRVFAFFGS